MTTALDPSVLDGVAIGDIDDSEYEFDMRVVESTTKVTVAMCGTDDGCGSTCEGSACTTFSNDPY
jgi:FxLD family lantipeptide